MFHVPEKYRVRTGDRGTDESYGNNGMFFLPANPKRSFRICVIASDGDGWEESGFPPPAWEHVSVSTVIRCPTWEEMCLVKSLFWDESDTVIQLHPPKSEYVNMHPYCLHMWRPVGVELALPPSLCVGYKARETA